jgi:hypothetical protein
MKKINKLSELNEGDVIRYFYDKNELVVIELGKRLERDNFKVNRLIASYNGWSGLEVNLDLIGGTKIYILDKDESDLLLL